MQSRRGVEAGHTGRAVLGLLGALTLRLEKNRVSAQLVFHAVAEFFIALPGRAAPERLRRG